jgi:hypothetical protein
LKTLDVPPQGTKDLLEHVGAIIARNARTAAPIEDEGRVQVDQSLPGILVLGLHAIQKRTGRGAD